MRNGTNVLGRVQVLGMLLTALAGVSLAQAQKPTVAIRSCEVRADIVGLTAVTTVEIVYVNYTNAQAEAQLQWSLPPDTAGADLSLWAGGLRAAGAIVPQVQARQIYQEIRDQRRDPALLEYQGSGQWSLRVFPIPANGTQKVQATFHQLLRAQNGWVRYDAPHVVSGTGTEAAEGIDVAMTIRAPGGVKDVRAVNHRVGVFRQGDGTVKAGWREENASLTPPVGIAYQPASAAPAVVSFTGADKNAYFLAAVSRALDPGEAAARNVVVIVDVSASMKGRPIEAAMAVAQRVLKALRQGERFSVVAAGPNVGLWKKQLVGATEADIISAIGYLEEAPVDGGADLAGALRAAASLAGETTPIEALLISDGQDMIGAAAGPESAPAPASKPAPQGPANLRVHVIGVNSDSVAMSDLALRANGTMLGDIRDKTEADAVADQFVEQMREVTFEDVKAVVKGQAPARNVVAAASGDAVFGGQVVKAGPAVVDITGTRDGKPFHKELTIEIPEPGKAPEGWGSGDLEPVMAHLRAEGMWDDLHNNANAKPDDLAALIAFSRQRRVATRATAFLVLETDGAYQ
ncbi:MAG: VIT domain-containing protein, partial [Planctomycetota bacterium]|nr:VIT domain-containing protein [Planctomycetota bacterium]